MDIFLYLTEKEWVNTWIDGGEIPISLASSYLSDERVGTKTPDENIIHKSEHPVPDLENYGISIKESKNITITNGTYNGQKIPDIKNADFYTDDGGILSFCNTLSEEISEKLGKKACVKITNIEQLRKTFGKQLGCKAIVKKCAYTNDHQRNHFLKSTEDSWQDEYRMFFPTTRVKSVKVPKGAAILMEIYE